MGRRRHLTLTSSPSGVSALAATGIRGMRWASGGGWNAADTAGPTASRARDDRRMRGSPGKPRAQIHPAAL